MFIYQSILIEKIMKKKSRYNYQIISILFIFFPSTQSLFLNKETSYKSNNYFKKFDKKIEKLKKEIDDVLCQISKNELLESILKKQIELKEEIQKSLTYKNIEYIQSCIELLEDLKKYNTALMQPKLLQRIDILFPSIKQQKKESLLALLLEQRIYLLEASDSFFSIRSIINKIELLLHEFTNQLNELKEQLKNETCYKDFITNNEYYMNHELVILLEKKITDLWDTYLEKESKLLQKKFYRQELYQDIENKKEYSQFSCSKELEKIFSIKNQVNPNNLFSH